MATSSDEDMKKTKFLYFILDEFTSFGRDHAKVRYTIHRFDLPSDSVTPTPTPPTRRPIPEPLLRLPSHTFPGEMGFAVVGSELYMVGGSMYPSPDASKGVFIIDTSLFSSRSLDDDYKKYVVDGPELTCPKVDPVLILVGCRLYAFARCLFPEDRAAIEFLDTDHDHEGSCWSLVYPPPPLPSRSFFPEHYKSLNDSEDEENPYRILSYTVAGSRIFLCLRMSLDFNAGVFILDTKSSTWQLVNNKLSTIPDNLPFYWNGIFWEKQGIWFNSRTTDGTVVVQDSAGRQKIIQIPRLSSPWAPIQSRIMEVDRDRGLVLAFSWYLPGCNYCPSLGKFMVVDIQLLHISCGGTTIESSGGKKRKRDSPDDDDDDDAYGCFCEWRTEFVSKYPSSFDHIDIPMCFLK